MSVNPQLYFIGDSLTEFGNTTLYKGWLTLLTDLYSRKADVVCRGYSGYNTNWQKGVFNDILNLEIQPKKDQIKLVTILMGSNDSVLDHSGQHVPLDQYYSNMKSMVESIQAVSLGIKILLITPPPAIEAHWAAYLKETYNITKIERTNESTESYAKAVSKLGEEINVPVLNLWEKFWPLQEDLYYDGLHLSVKGNQLLAQSWLDAVSVHFPNLSPDSLSFAFPEWRNFLN